MLPLKYSAVAKPALVPPPHTISTVRHPTNGPLSFHLQVVQHSFILLSPSKFRQSRARPYSPSLSAWPGVSCLIVFEFDRTLVRTRRFEFPRSILANIDMQTHSRKSGKRPTKLWMGSKRWDSSTSKATAFHRARWTMCSERSAP